MILPAPKFTPEKKREIVIEYLAGDRSVAEICREHQVTATSLGRWREQFVDAGLAGFEAKRASNRERALEEEVERLQRIIGEQAVALHILKGGTTRSMGKQGGRGRR